MIKLIWIRLGELKKLQKMNAKLTWNEPVPHAALDKAEIKAFDSFKTWSMNIDGQIINKL